MNNQKNDDLFYVCTLIEYIGRETCNHRKDVISYFDKRSLNRQLRLAGINHCLSFEQVAGELIEEHGIPTGDFNTVKECKYTVPSVTSIGRVYQMLILATCTGDDVAQAMTDVFSSFISDEISDFNSSVYYRNPDYLRCSYLEGRLLS